MPPDGFHPPLEEYLEAIHGLSEEGVQVIQARLVERLHHSPQAVSEMVQRLAADGYLVRSAKGVELTDAGRSRAASVVRRHRLAERFLVDILGLPWEKAHVEAGRWEHVISDEVESRLVALLGNPTTCPHGNPIPGSTWSRGPEVSMTTVEEGTTVRLDRITEQIETDSAALAYLSANGLIPGRDVTVRSRAPDGTITLDVADNGHSQTIAVGAAMCRQLFVVPA